MAPNENKKPAFLFFRIALLYDAKQASEKNCWFLMRNLAPVLRNSKYSTKMQSNLLFLIGKFVQVMQSTTYGLLCSSIQATAQKNGKEITILVEFFI